MSDDEMPDPLSAQAPDHAPQPRPAAPGPPPVTNHQPPPYAVGTPGAPYQTVTPEQREIWATKGSRALRFGAAWIVGGLLITTTTYSAASDGGVYFVAWGPVVYGLYRIVAGLWLLNKSRN